MNNLIECIGVAMKVALFSYAVLDVVVMYSE